MHNDPQVLIQNGCIPKFRRFFHSPGMFLLFRCPSLLGSVYTPTFFSDLKALLCCALRVWYRSCSEHGGRCSGKTTPRQVLHVLVRRKIGGVPCRENL